DGVWGRGAVWRSRAGGGGQILSAGAGRRGAGRGAPLLRIGPGIRTLLSEALAGRPGSVRRVPMGRERSRGPTPVPRPTPGARHGGAPPRFPRSRSPANAIGGTERRVSLQPAAPRERSARTRRCEVGR